MNVRGMLFDSFYEIITWVFIALSISAFFYFLSKSQARGMVWSGVALVECVVIMVGLIADKYVAEHILLDASEPLTGIEVGGTLDPTAPLETRFVVTNHGDSTVREAWSEVEMWDTRYHGPLFAQPDFARFEIKPHSQITVDGRFLGFGVIYLKNPAALMLQVTIHYKVGLPSRRDM
jgi:hypothetical protein